MDVEQIFLLFSLRLDFITCLGHQGHSVIVLLDCVTQIDEKFESQELDVLALHLDPFNCDLLLAFESSELMLASLDSVSLLNPAFVAFLTDSGEAFDLFDELVTADDVLQILK